MLSQEIAASNRTRMSVERVITASGMENGNVVRPGHSLELYSGVSGRNSVEKGLSAHSGRLPRAGGRREGELLLGSSLSETQKDERSRR